jgi:hypothetical protein
MPVHTDPRPAVPTNTNEWRWVPIAKIKPYSGHARRHSKPTIEKIKKIIDRYGQVVPIVIDPANVIVDGHAVWQAMRELGAGEIAAVVVSGRSNAEVNALRLALNRVPQEAGWDKGRLREEFKELMSLSFDLDLTGFDAVEINHVLDVGVPKFDAGDDDEILPRQEEAVSAHGDIWVCGGHRLGCGDAVDRDFIDRVCNKARPAICFIDPSLAVAALEQEAELRKFVKGSRELISERLIGLLADALRVLKTASSEAGLIYACMDWRHVFELLAAGRRCGLSLRDMCVWAKTSAGMGALYRSQHELICVFQSGVGQSGNNVELGRLRRTRSNVWTCRGVNVPNSDRDGVLAVFPTVKPMPLVADAIRDATKRGDFVLDTFMVSGSTIMAAEETGRIGFGIESNALYVDVAVRRWQKRSRDDAVHAETGERFNDRAARLASIEQNPND